MSKRRKYSAEFKHEAVALGRQPGVSCRQVALEIGINPNMLTRCKRSINPVLPKLATGNQTGSMSAVGHCADNAACEGFFGMLKRERVNHRSYRTGDEARADLFDYIERLHNPRMRRRVAEQDQKFQPFLNRL
jgi:hypothetical protein